MYNSLDSVPNPLRPPNIAALLTSNDISVKLKHGGGACPVILTDDHRSRGVSKIMMKRS